MEASSSSSPIRADEFTGTNDEKVREELQQRHNNQLARIEELKNEIQTVKIQLENVTKECSEEKMEGFRRLKEKYNMMRNEYNALVDKAVK